MALKIARVGTAAVLGAGDGALRSKMPNPAFTLGAEPIHWHTVAEVFVLVGGAAMQFLAPYTFPDVVDGAVDGAAFGLASNVTGRLLGGAAATTPYLHATRGVASRVGPSAFSYYEGRPAVGTSPTATRRVRLQ